MNLPILRSIHYELQFRCCRYCTSPICVALGLFDDFWFAKILPRLPSRQFETICVKSLHGIFVSNLCRGGHLQALGKKAATYLFHIVLCVLISTQIALADWVSLSGAETAPNIAEIYVLDDGVRIELEIYIGDLRVFEDLLPGRLLQNLPLDRPSLSQRLDRFSKETLVVSTDKGTLLPVRLDLLDLRIREERYSPFAGMINPTTGRPVPVAPADKRVVYVELFYPFEGERPDTLTFTPPLNQKGAPSVTIGFLAFHQTVPIIDFRFLTRSEQLNMDWQDPWYTTFKNTTYKRRQKDAMRSFIYIEPREVRHEALFRVRDMNDWIDLGLEGKTEISPNERNSIKQKIADFVASKNALKVDGVGVAPDRIKADFVAVTSRGIVLVDDDRPLDLATTLVGVVQTYRVEALPQEVTVDWELFGKRQKRVFVTLVDPAGPFISYVEPDDPVIRWENFLQSYQEPVISPVVFGNERLLRLPALTIVVLLLTVVVGISIFRKQTFSNVVGVGILVVLLAGAGASTLTGWVALENPLAGPPNEKSATRIVKQITENLHHALRENVPDTLDNALKISVVSAALAQIKPEIKRALVIEIQGGSSANIESIGEFVVKNIQPVAGEDGFRASTEWSVQATGNHWGHPHLRKFRFNALMEIAPIDGMWKLTGITVTSARSVK